MTARDDDSQRATTSIVQGIQHAVGINLRDIAGWIGPLLGTAWLWTAQRTSAQPGPALMSGTIPAEAPLPWLGRLAHSLTGWNLEWATSTHHWLTDHRFMAVLLIATAIFTATRQTLTARATPTILLLLLNISIIGVPATVATYLGTSLVLCLIAMAADQYSRPGGANPYISLVEWFRDCAGTIVLIALAPIILIGYVVESFRVPELGPSTGFEAARTITDLPDGTLADVPARDAIAALAQAILIAQDDNHRSEAIFSLDRPRGARPIDLHTRVRRVR